VPLHAQRAPIVFYFLPFVFSVSVYITVMTAHPLSFLFLVCLFVSRAAAWSPARRYFFVLARQNSSLLYVQFYFSRLPAPSVGWGSDAGVAVRGFLRARGAPSVHKIK
jgi:hypothetical protein